MKSFVLTVLALGLAVAFFAPHGNETAARKATAGAFAMPAAKRDRSLSYGGEMVLDRQDDGHFYATAHIDGRDYSMLVDTGASVVALTGKDAQDMGFDWNPGDLAPVVRGAGGPVMGVPVKIDDISVGDFEAHDVEAVIIPEGLPISLLGQSFLRQVPSVQIANDTLKLSD